MDNCLVINVSFANNSKNEDEYKLNEALELAHSLELNVVGNKTANIREINAATYLSKGFLEDIKNNVEELEVDLCVVNAVISAVQQRNLENFLKVKVLDRNGLIINIFANRAQTREGVLQVKLASLMYQKSRLVKAWGHLERQRGGGGFIGGPGETQKELDKRMISDDIDQVKKLLEKVKKNRHTQAKQRRRQNFKVVALVGYTNAGKSTLFKALTGEDVLVKDLLFATLDPIMRITEIASKQKIILLDTVGFISDLPHQLIEAFHSTLEEVLVADVILHVIDASQDSYISQINSVKEVLHEIGISKDMYKSKVLEVYNKIDLLSKEDKELFTENILNNQGVVISAQNKINLDLLQEVMFTRLYNHLHNLKLKITYDKLDVLDFIFHHTTILNRTENDTEIEFDLLISQDNLQQLHHKFNLGYDDL